MSLIVMYDSMIGHSLGTVILLLNTRIDRCLHAEGKHEMGCFQTSTAPPYTVWLKVTVSWAKPYQDKQFRTRYTPSRFWMHILSGSKRFSICKIITTCKCIFVVIATQIYSHFLCSLWTKCNSRTKWFSLNYVTFRL